MNSDIIFTDASGIISNDVEPDEARECKTTCPYCGVGCGVTATIKNNTIIGVKGDTSHPANYGRLCVKGSSLHETLGQHDRILSPRVHGKETSWEEATRTVADKFTQIIKEHGPDAVAFYLSGQLLTEDYYVANKLMKGFIGSGNADTNSRLCMASASTAYKRAFGEDVVPGCYEDLELADVIFIVGSNAAYAHPIVYQRIIKAKEQNPALKIIVIDPRATATSETADLHLAIKPGSDAYYFNGLLIYLFEQNKLDDEYIDQHCQGFEQTLQTAQTQLSDMSAVAAACDIELSQLLESYQYFADNKNVVTMFSQGINQSSSGVDKGNAIINCHLASGKIGYEGAGPFSITGQPNAMGGREVGGLVTQLAAHLNFDNPAAIDKVKRFWNAPNIATQEGLKAVDMFKAVDEGKIKAIWVMATNPVVSMPDANFVKQALKKCSMVVVSECYENGDTVQCADVVFPASTWGEKHGTVTNSERRISLQKGLVLPPGEAKHDWKIVCEVAEKMGFGEAFNYQHPVEIFREHAELSGFENASEKAIASANVSTSTNTAITTESTHQPIKRIFDISALATISLEDYQQFTPVQWPVTKEYPQGTARFFKRNKKGGIAETCSTQTGKANIIPIIARLPQHKAQDDEVIMNTGRIRDQWHTMTRTGRATKLMAHFSEPFIQVHPEDAKRFNVNDKQLAQLNNLGATYLGRVNVSNQQRLGEVFVPIHWNDNFSKSARVSALVNPITDPICGQPEFKHSPVKLAPFKTVWSGYLISATALNTDKLSTDYWSQITLEAGVKYLLADTKVLSDSEALLQSMYPAIDDWVVLKDDQLQELRIAGFVDEKLRCFFIGSTALDKQYNTRFIEQQLDQVQQTNHRYRLLAGVDSDGSNDVGDIVCACFQVGEKTIQSAIAAGECKTVAALGNKLKCGTNCGSCIPELKALLS